MSKQVPNVKFVIRPEKEFITITSDDIFKDKTIVLFALPGAFTPTCNDYHLPGYELNYDELKKLGIDEVYCLSANDPFVMKAWAKNLDLKKVKMLPDADRSESIPIALVNSKFASGNILTFLRSRFFAQAFNTKGSLALKQ